MIVRQDKSFETRSDKPNTNWYEEENFIVDETTEEGKQLANKMINNYPYYDLVIEDGKLVDVILLPKPEPLPPVPTELELLQQKVSEQDMVLEEIMFVIIPEMMGGGM